MATRLSEVAVGSVVKLNENGVPTDFYVATHNYEVGLNGSGRTLLVRKDCYSLRRWHEDPDASYPDSELSIWLNNTYKNVLDYDIQELIGSTTFYYTPCVVGTSPVLTPVSRPVFMLSITELGHTVLHDGVPEGTELPISSMLRIAYRNGRATEQWTRTPEIYSTNNISKQRCAYSVNEEGNEERLSKTNSHGTRPAFTLPESLYLLDDGSLTVNVPPEISGDVVSGANIGIKNESISFSYTVNDADSAEATADEYLDGILINSRSVILGQSYSVEISGLDFQKVLNGEHVISVVANDGIADSTPYEVRFTKKVTSASVTLKEPLDADDEIQVAVLAIVGSVPADAEIQVLLTNNAHDEQPVWEDATAAVIARENYVFTNRTAQNGFAFNFRVTVSRGESDTAGYITSVGGAFQ